MKFYNSTTTLGNYAIKGATVSRQSKNTWKTVVNSASVTFTRQCLFQCGRNDEVYRNTFVLSARNRRAMADLYIKMSNSACTAH